MLTEWKKQDDLQFLNEVSCVPLQQGLRHLQKAFFNFFDGRTKYPNFKKKRNGHATSLNGGNPPSGSPVAYGGKPAFSAGLTAREWLGSAEFTKSAFKWKNGQVFLAKCSEALPIRWSRELPQGANPSTITVKLSPAGRWTVSLLVDIEIEPLPKSQNEVGVDLGLTCLVALSSGEKIANPRSLNTKRRQLKNAQKALSRKLQGSNNRHKARLKVAKVYREIISSPGNRLR